MLTAALEAELVKQMRELRVRLYNAEDLVAAMSLDGRLSEEDARQLWHALGVVNS
jgi:hypothetical protein